MSRSNSSERRSRRRSGTHPATPLSSTAAKRRKRRLTSNRKQHSNPSTPPSPSQAPSQAPSRSRREQRPRRAAPPSQTFAQTSFSTDLPYPHSQSFPSQSAPGGPDHYLPPALPYAETHAQPPAYANPSYGFSSRPRQVAPSTSSSSNHPQGQPRDPQGWPSTGATRNTAKETRFGPSPRRRHELSSNPAFGQSRNRQRHGQQRRRPGAESGHNTAANQARTVDLAAPTARSPQLLRQPGARQVGLRQAGLEHVRSGQVRSGQVGSKQRASEQAVRTQALRPRPVVPSRSRLRTQSAESAIARPHSQRSLAPSPSRSSSSRSIVKAKPRRRPPKPVSPVMYGLRLLILGTGVGVIAGTVIAIFNPAQMGPTARTADITAMGNLAENESGQPTTASMGGIGEGFPASELAVADMNVILKQQPYAELARQLKQMGQAQEGLLPGIFVLDLDTYNYVDVNGSMSFAAASTIKVPILVAFFQDVEQGKIQLDEMLTMTAADVAVGSGDMQYGTVGDQYSAIETATKMIVISDNTATNMLIQRLGGATALNQRFRSWGLDLTQIRNPLPDLEGTNTTSPSELTHLMVLVSEGKLLSLRSRDRMLDIMSRTKTNTLLPAGIGDNAAIAHKTGDIGSMVGDTGLVDTTTGKRYAITLLMGRPHNDSRAQELIRQMAGHIHDAIQSPPVEPVMSLPAETPTTTNTPENSSTHSVDE